MSCCKIQVLDIPVSVPERFKDDNGNLFLTMSEEQGIELYKQLEEQTVLNNLKVDAVLGFDVEADERNRAIFEAFFDPNIVDNDYSPVLVYLWTGGVPDILISLYVLARNQGRTYSVELRAGGEHWAIQLKDMLVKDLDFPDFEVTDANIAENWQQHARYLESTGNPGYWFPMVDFGKWIYEKFIHPADFRPHFHAIAVARKLMCKAGWVLDDSFLESDAGRRWITYILKNDYGRDTFEGEDESFRVEIEGTEQSFYGYNNDYWYKSPDEQWHKILWDKEVYDPQDYYNQSTGNYSAIGIYQFVAELDVLFIYEHSTWDNTRSILTVELVHEKKDGTIIELDSSVIRPTRNASGGITAVLAEATLVSDDVVVKPGDKVWVRHHWAGDDDVTVVAYRRGSAFYGRRVGSWYDRGDVIKMSEEIDPELTGYEFISGITHLYKGLFFTDWANKTVRIRPPFEVKELYDRPEDVEGFYIETQAYDIGKLAVCDSDSVTTPNLENLNRYFRLKFKDSKCKFIERERMETENDPLFGAKIDLKYGKRNEEEVSENPIFEPTANAKSDTAPAWEHPPEIPHMWDNDEGKLSYDIGFRVLYAAGWIPVKMELPGTDGGSIVPIYFYWAATGGEGGIQHQKYPFAFQFTNSEKTTRPFHENLTFDAERYSLLELFYDRWLREQYLTQRITLDAFLTPEDYQKMQFRQLLTFELDERTVFARLMAIEGYNACRNAVTPVVAAPLLQSLDCLIPGSGLLPEGGGDGDVSGRAPGCPGNEPELVITENGNCFDFSLGGTNESVVDTVTFEVQMDGESVWTQMAQICDPPTGFTVRMIVTYEDGCPDQVRKKYVDPCGNAPELILDYNYSTGCFTIEIGGINSSVIDEANTVITYTVDGGAEQTYNGEVCGETGEICIDATVVYEDGCEDVELSVCHTIPDEPINCEDIEEAAGLQCVTQGDGSITIERTGNIDQLVVALDFIKYRPVGGTDAEWKVYEGEKIYDCPIEAQRVILTCDGQCPPICTPIIECDCTATPPCNIEVILKRTGANELTAFVTGATNIEYTWYEYMSGTGWIEIPGVTGDVFSNAQEGIEYMVQAKDADIPTCVDQDEYVIPGDCIPPELTIISETNDNGQIDIVFEVTGITGVGDIDATANGNPLTVNDASPPADRYSVSYSAAPGETTVTIVLEATNSCDTVSWTEDYPICYDPTVVIDTVTDNGCGEYDIDITTTNIDNAGQISVNPGGTIVDNGGGSWTITGVDAGSGTGTTTFTVTVTNACGTDDATTDLAQCPPPTIILDNEYEDGTEYVVEFSTTNVNDVSEITGLGNGVSPNSLTWDAGTQTGVMRFDLQSGTNTWDITVNTCCGTDSINGTHDWSGCPPEGTQQNTLSC